MEDLRPDNNNDLHPPAHVDGGDPDDWSKEDDPMVEDGPPSATETPAPSFEDMKDEAQASIQSLQLEPKGKDKEMSTHEEDEELDEKEENNKRHLNVVFIGHVDAGKSTTGGQILFLSGQVDDRTIQKYEKEAKDKSRESWYMAYIMDTNEEERIKGKTVEVGRAHFETDTTRFTILDAPMHGFKAFFYLVGPMWPLLQLKRGCLGMGHIQLKTPGPGPGPLESWTAVEDRKQRRRTDCSTNVSIFS